MPAHQSELEEKKRQLQAIRERRERRTRDRAAKTSGGAPATALDALKDFKLPKVNRTGKLTVTKIEPFEEKRNPYVSIEPMEKIGYDQEVQTMIAGIDAPEILKEGALEQIQEKEAELVKKTEELQASLAEKDKAIAELKEGGKKKKKEEKKVPVLSDEERSSIMHEAAFDEFFTRTSKTMELVLQANETFDPTVDYTFDPNSGEEHAKGASIEFSLEYKSEKLTLGRTVTALDYNPKHKELLCVAYNENPDTPNMADGIVLVWNRKDKSGTPFFYFECQSAVLSCCFSPFMPNVIVGGTYSGEVVLWDNRTSKRTPVQRSTITTEQGHASHTHPVYCLDIVGTQNAHFLVTASTDAKMCNWDLDTLTAPQDTLELQSGNNKQLAATAFSFPANDSNNFVFGTEDGAIYQCSRHGSKAGVGTPFARGIGPKSQATPLPAHHGPVTGVNFFRAGQEFSHLFLTASTDWTVKLWTYKKLDGPLYTFDTSEDYVYDVAWSPKHPAVFAHCNGAGCLDIWNLNSDIEEPIVHEVIDGGKEGLNRLKWSKDGKELAIGTASGRVLVYRVSDAIAKPENMAKETEALKARLEEMEEALSEAAAAATAATAAVAAV